MKKYLLRKKGETKPIGVYDSKYLAAKKMEKTVNDSAGSEECLTPFDFECDEIEIEVESYVRNYESACEYLGVHHNFACCPPDNRHHKAMVALFKLVTIAEAWNKIDEFTPDFSNEKQHKHYPWFKYQGAASGFAFAYSAGDAAGTYTNVGSRLCFKTSERARQFGERFIDLWNDFLLIK
ncbi:MAG: hypothetical protein LBR26_16040 [Prevotella sp.]|jgi:hypothetical protein|nr:hypothetical protein [Prevotella sp.]